MGEGTEVGDTGRTRAPGASAGPELRWVGAQHLMHGYCGRAPADAGLTANSGVTAEAAAAEAAGAARAYAVRPAALLDGRRHLVVRIGPRAAGAGAERLASPAVGGGDGETDTTRARAA